MLTVLDLFSGIGGFSLGLERTGGFKTVAFCEIDPFCRKVLAKHWPGVPIHDDIRTASPPLIPKVSRTMSRKCPNCRRQVSGHPNKKFCAQRCKDNYHNRTNPRGYGAEKSDWDRYVDEMHPFSSEALGQD